MDSRFFTYINRILTTLLLLAVITSAHADEVQYWDSISADQALFAVAGLHELAQYAYTDTNSDASVAANRGTSAAANARAGLFANANTAARAGASGLISLKHNTFVLIETVEDGLIARQALQKTEYTISRKTAGRLYLISLLFIILLCLSLIDSLCRRRVFSGRLSFKMLVSGIIISFIHSQDGMKIQITG